MHREDNPLKEKWPVNPFYSIFAASKKVEWTLSMNLDGGVCFMILLLA